jgi:hypothetical protein
VTAGPSRSEDALAATAELEATLGRFERLADGQRAALKVENFALLASLGAQKDRLVADLARGVRSAMALAAQLDPVEARSAEVRARLTLVAQHLALAQGGTQDLIAEVTARQAATASEIETARAPITQGRAGHYGMDVSTSPTILDTRG